jgi:hypothetical protein
VSYSDVQARRDPLSPPGRRPFGAVRAVLLLVAVALVGGCVDVVTGTGLRLGFAIGLAFGSLLAAMLVHRHGLLTVVFAPPLVFLAASLLFVLVSPSSSGSNGRLLDAATGWLVYGFPTMATATGVAVVTAGIRVSSGGRHRPSAGSERQRY